MLGVLETRCLNHVDFACLDSGWAHVGAFLFMWWSGYRCLTLRVRCLMSVSRKTLFF